MTQPGPDAAVLFAEASTLTGLDTQQLQDWLSESPEDQIEILNGWKALDTIGWTTRTSTIQRLVEIFTLIGNIAGVAGGIAGATSAIVALGKL